MVEIAFSYDDRLLALVTDSNAVQIGTVDAFVNFQPTAALSSSSSENVVELAWAPRAVGDFLAVLYSNHVAIYTHGGQLYCNYEFEFGNSYLHLQWVDNAFGVLIVWNRSRVTFLQFNKRKKALVEYNLNVYPTSEESHQADARISAVAPTSSGKVLYVANDHELHAVHVPELRPSREKPQVNKLLIDPILEEAGGINHQLTKIKALACDGESVCFGAAEAAMSLPPLKTAGSGKQSTSIVNTGIRPLLDTLEVADSAPSSQLEHRGVMESLLSISGQERSNIVPAQQNSRSQAAGPRLMVFTWQPSTDFTAGVDATRPRMQHNPVKLVHSTDLPQELAVPDVIAFHRPHNQTVGHLAIGSNTSRTYLAHFVIVNVSL